MSERILAAEWLPYDGEMCHACDKRKAVKIVTFDGGHVALCRTCRPEAIYERQD